MSLQWDLGLLEALFLKEIEIEGYNYRNDLETGKRQCNHRRYILEEPRGISG